jgi:hypothetical protein
VSRGSFMGPRKASWPMGDADGNVSGTTVTEATTTSFSTLQRGRRVPSMVAGGAGRRKPDWPLRSEAVKRTLTVGQELKKEIPVETR